MNREQRRDLSKRLQQRMSKDDAETLVDSIKHTYSPSQSINEGDKVKININLIKGRKDYERMSSRYKEFVESSEDVVFSAHVERKNLVSFKEEPRWLFWSGDLEIVDSNNSKLQTK